jgi:hypothetical protein
MTSSLRHLLVAGTALLPFAAADVTFAQPLELSAVQAPPSPPDPSAALTG